MRKVIFVLLVVSSICYQVTIDKFNDRILVSDDSFGLVERKNAGKSFLPYFYTPEDIILRINGDYNSQGTIVKLEGNNDFYLTTEIPKLPERLPYTGKEVTPKELPFYFLELYQENQLAVLFLSDQIRTVHFPTNTPITFRIITHDVYGEYKLTLRGDDISLVESVKLITIVNDNHEAKSQIELNADKDKVFTSPILKNDQKETIILEINLIKGKEVWLKYLNFLQADIHFIKSDTRATQIENKPEYLSVGDVFRKRTQIGSYDDFIIEFPQDQVTLIKTTLSKNAPKDLINVVVSQGRIHVTHRGLTPDESRFESTLYEIEAEFVVKSLPKVSEPIVIARYNLESLKNTDGFVVRGSYYDDKIYFKVSSQTILENNIYFSFNYSYDLTPKNHQISIGYDALPSSEFVNFTEFKFNTQIVELKVDKNAAQKNKIIIIALKRSKDSELKSTLSYFEVKVTHDIYKTINSSRDIVEYSLRKGQSIFINNYGLNSLENTFLYDVDSQEILIDSKNGEVVSYAKRITEGGLNFRFSNLNGLFSFNDGNEFNNYKKFIYRNDPFGQNRPNELGSVIIITAITDQASGTITTGLGLKREIDSTDINSLVFLK